MRYGSRIWCGMKNNLEMRNRETGTDLNGELRESEK